jgi:hypothetical protein
MPTNCSDCGIELGNDIKTCPQCGGAVGGKLHLFRMLAGIAIGLSLVSLVGHLGKSLTSPTGTATHASTPDGQGDVSVFSVTAHEIATAYDSNSTAAVERFRNSRFTVSGIIAAIDRDAAGGSVIVLDGGMDRAAHPQATLSDSEKTRTAGLAKGAAVSMVCTGHGDATSMPLMKNCVIKP